MKRVPTRTMAEGRLLLLVFALNGISYLPMLTLPWFIASLSSEMHLGATSAGFAGSLLIGMVALVSGIAALRITPRSAQRVGLVGGVVSLAVLILVCTVPASRTLPLLLLAGAGGGLACCGANALIAASRDPIRLSGSMWGLSVLWQIIIWWIAPMAMTRAGASGLFGVQAVATGFLLAIGLLMRCPPPPEMHRPEKAANRPAISLRLILALGLCSMAFWARDSMSWSLVDSRAGTLGVGLATLQLTLTGVSLIGFAASLAAAAIGLRFGRMIMVVLSQLAALVVLTLMAGAASAPIYLTALLLWSGVTMFAWPYVMELAVAIDPEGRVAVLCGALLFAASAVGPALGGLVIGKGPGGLVAMTVGLGIAAVAASAYVAWHLRPPPRPASPPDRETAGGP